jgi:hypothetical protein
MQKLIDGNRELEVVGIYDFGYDINTPVEVTTATEDVVYVLKKRR